MAVAHRASQAGSGNTTTSIAITIPASVATDDILILSVTNGGATADPTVVDTDVGGNAWAKLGGGSTGLSVWWKRATSGTAGKVVTASLLTNSCSGNLSAFSGASKAATPYENVATESNASADETHAGITTTRDGCMVVLTIANRTNDLATSSQAATDPATLTERAEHTSMGGLDTGNVICAAVRTTAGATGNMTWAQTDAATVSCGFDILPAVSLTADAGTFAATLRTATLAVTMAAATQALAITGNAATLVHGRPMAADSGSFSLSGSAATFGVSMAADAGSFALAGSTATLAVSMPADVGTFALTGNAADLVYTPGAGPSIAAESGSFTLTGYDSAITSQRRIVADVAAFDATAHEAALAVAMAADTVSLSLTGSDALLQKGYGVLADASTYALTAHDVVMLTTRILPASLGTFALTGQSASFVYNPQGGGGATGPVFLDLGGCYFSGGRFHVSV